MRHRKAGKHLGRTSSHRRLMFRNMAISLIEHEIIKTTVVKAKELRRVVEPLITLAKVDGAAKVEDTAKVDKDSTAKRRLAFSRLRNKDAVKKLFGPLALRYQTRPGGYLRILKCGSRVGDNAPMAIVELVDRQSASLAE